MLKQRKKSTKPNTQQNKKSLSNEVEQACILSLQQVQMINRILLAELDPAFECCPEYQSVGILSAGDNIQNLPA